MELFSPEKYSDTVATLALIVSMIAVPLSGFFSYRYAVKGEKRKEFNAIADGIRLRLRSDLSMMQEDRFPYPYSPNTSIESLIADLNMLADVSHKKNKEKLMVLCSRYEEAIDSSTIYEDGLAKSNYANAISILFEIMALAERQ